ncbi:MAG: hypothetical protein FJY10_08340 [Bacteroidetes bacterium]|nr:hypothetical protein [Bacteroidota bacterium]
MEKKIAQGISFLFHPLIIPTYMLILLLQVDDFLIYLIPLNGKVILAALIFILTFLIPLFLTFIMKWLRIIQSYYMVSREERIFPYIATAIFYFMAFFLVRRLEISETLNIYLLGATLIVLAGLFLNFVQKVSMHMMALGGMTGWLMSLIVILGVDVNEFLFLVILITGITGTARMILDAHKPVEIYTGLLTGFGIMFLLFFFLRSIG